MKEAKYSGKEMIKMSAIHDEAGKLQKYL